MSQLQTTSWIHSTNSAVEQRFAELADEWKASIGVTPTVMQMAMHPAYQQIIGMGPAVLPAILRDLERETNHWFWALKSITGVDPVPEKSRGRITEMRDAWLQWGREHGYLESNVVQAF